MSSYTDFIVRKTQWQSAGGFQCGQLPSFLYDFQAHLVEWALSLGRAAIFADCGMGKTAIQLAWASQVAERENRSVLIVTPLAVGAQTVAEAEKFGVTAERSRNGQHSGSADIVVTNYEQLHKFNPSEFAGVVCDESSANEIAANAVQYHGGMAETYRKLVHELVRAGLLREVGERVCRVTGKRGTVYERCK